MSFDGSAPELICTSYNKHPGTSPWECWYGAGIVTGVAVSTFTYATNDKLYLFPEFISETVTIDKLGWEVVANAAGNGRAGIWAANSRRDKYPGKLLADSGSVANSNAVKTATLGTALVLTPGLYWFGFLSSAGAASMTLRGAAAASAWGTLGFPSTIGTNAYCGASLSGAASQAQSSALSVWADPMPAGVVLVTGGGPMTFYHCSG